MRLLTLMVLIFLTLPILLLSKISFENDTLIGANSDFVDIRLIIDDLSVESLLEFDIIVSNPTVCYIKEIINESEILTNSLVPKESGVFSASIKVEKGISGLSLKTKLLSGYDSTTTISIKNVVINGEPSESDSMVINNKYAYGIGPYIRFLDNSLPYPNPLKSGEKSNIVFTNDIDLEIELNVCNIKGEVLRNEKILFSKGKNNIEIKTNEYSAGVYFITAISKIGSFYERIVVYK